MQHHVVPYDEVLIKFPDDDNTEILIYFEPKEIRVFRKDKPTTLYRIYNILDHYLTTGIIDKNSMVFANKTWKELKKSAR